MLPHMMLKPSALAAPVLDLCCGGKKCPVLTDVADGGVAIADPDQTDKPIRLTAEQLAAIVPWLAARRSR